MDSLKYEMELLERLKILPGRLMVAFALLTALRIYPAYKRFHDKTGRGTPGALALLVEQLWEDVNGKLMSENDVKLAAARALELVPAERDGWENESQPYAEDAAAAIAYALRTRLSFDPQEAVWAARRVYESAEHFAATSIQSSDGILKDEQRIMEQPFVLNEIARQRRDLDELTLLADSEGNLSSLSMMRKRSEREAEFFFRSGDS